MNLWPNCPPENLQNLTSNFFLKAFLTASIGICFFGKLLAQDISENEVPDKKFRVGLTFGGLRSNTFGKDFNGTNAFKNSAEGGLVFQYNPSDEILVESGFLASFRGYRIKVNNDTVFTEEGYTVANTNGVVRLYYLEMPFSMSYSLHRKLKVFGGIGFGFRYFYDSKYRTKVSVKTKDSSFYFDSSYTQLQNNAIDFLDASAFAGVSYKPHKRFEIRAQASGDLFGLSLAQENFISRNNNNGWFSFRLVYWLGEFDSLFGFFEK